MSTFKICMTSCRNVMLLSDNLKHLELEQIKVPMIGSCFTLRIGPYSFYIKKLLVIS